ncbi:hypothetical protein LJR125_000839 [Pseudoxanthomonas sp. LjRoot125]|jgi:hypothetical protein|uniref:hypothetical protein n=1 Tax=Pseudoxanthomonas sp. LjRoot125 TaxID=3342258 RepID=UPI003E11E68F
MTPGKKLSPTTPGVGTGNSGNLFAGLRELLLPYQDDLQVVHNDPAHFYANCARPDEKGKARFFGAVKVSGRKCLFHFMPIYDFPDLLGKISPALKKRMQGKSCFNFESMDQDLVAELKGLVGQGVERYRASGKL